MVMQECILFITNVNKSGVQSRDQFFNRSQVNIPYGKLWFRLFNMVLYYPFVMQKGYSIPLGSRIND